MLQFGCNRIERDFYIRASLFGYDWKLEGSGFQSFRANSQIAISCSYK